MNHFQSCRKFFSRYWMAYYSNVLNSFNCKNTFYRQCYPYTCSMHCKCIMQHRRVHNSLKTYLPIYYITWYYKEICELSGYLDVVTFILLLEFLILGNIYLHPLQILKISELRPRLNLYPSYVTNQKITILITCIMGSSNLHRVLSIRSVF